MKEKETMKKLIASFLGVGFAFAFVPGLVAQSVEVDGPDFDSVVFVSDYVEDDTAAASLESPVLFLKYVGDEESGTVDQNANALELHSGDLGSEDNAPTDASDVNTGDVCGTTNNALDITDTECDTPAELCNVINDSGAPWVCALAGVDGADTFGTAGDYIDPADSQAKRPGGLALVADASATDTLAVLVRPDVGSGRAAQNPVTVDRFDAEVFLKKAKGTVGSTVSVGDYYEQELLVNPFAGRQVALTRVVANLDSTSAWTLRVYCVRYKRDGRRDQRVIYETDDTADVTEEALDFSDAPLVCGPGEAAVVEAEDDALVTGSVSYVAQFWPVQ